MLIFAFRNIKNIKVFLLLENSNLDDNNINDFGQIINLNIKQNETFNYKW